MSLLRLSNYQGKPYSAGHSNSKATEFSGLNLLKPPQEISGVMGKANQLLVPVKLELEKGPEYRVIQTLGEEELPPVSILNPEAYQDYPVIDHINYSAIHFKYRGQADLELDNGEMIPVEDKGYTIDLTEESILGRQEFEVLSEDVAHEERDDIALYPLGARIDPGLSIDCIQPVYFRVSQQGGETELKVVTTDRIKSVGGFYSSEGFSYDDNHYVFMTSGEANQHKTLFEYVKSGGITLKLSLGMESSGAAAAGAASASTETIEVRSNNVYGSKLDELIIGFDLSTVRL